MTEPEQNKIDEIIKLVDYNYTLGMSKKDATKTLKEKGYSEDEIVEGIRKYKENKKSKNDKNHPDNKKSDEDKLRTELKELLNKRFKETSTILNDKKWDISKIVGSDYAKKSIEKCLNVFVKNKERLRVNGIRVNCGKILVGLPGTAKTEICISSVVKVLQDVKYKDKYKLIIMSVSDFTGRKNELGQSDIRCHMLFSIMREYNKINGTNIIIYIDECQTLLKGATTSNNIEERTNVIFKELGGIYDIDNSILLLGSMNNPSGVDVNFFSHGRFGLPLVINLPTKDERLIILKNHTKILHFKDDVDLNYVNNYLNTYAGRDVSAFVGELQIIYDDRVDSGKYNPHPYISIADIMKVLISVEFRNTTESNIIKLFNLSKSLTSLGVIDTSNKSDEELIKDLDEKVLTNRTN